MSPIPECLEQSPSRRRVSNCERFTCHGHIKFVNQRHRYLDQFFSTFTQIITEYKNARLFQKTPVKVRKYMQLGFLKTSALTHFKVKLTSAGTAYFTS
jgi:hypothetical protein